MTAAIAALRHRSSPGPQRTTDRAAAVGGSAMTLLERAAYLSPAPGETDVTHGYPQGITPAWIRACQLQPATGWTDTPPAVFARIIEGYFRDLFRAGEIYLTPSCSLAFAIAAMAVIREPGDEVIVLDRSFDCWPILLEALGGRVVYARRGPGGVHDPAAIAAACTERTRAVVIVSPDNPLGVICPEILLRQVAALCEERDLVLVADHSLAEVNPWRRHIPLLPGAAGRDLSWIALGGTSKLLGLCGSGLGALAFPPRHRDAIEAAASPWFCQYNQYDLAVIASVLPSCASWQLELSERIAANYALLREHVPAPLTVTSPDAGCFALVDGAGLGLDDVAFAALLKDRYRVLTVPVSWFPSGKPALEAKIRVSLSRPPDRITRLARALRDCAAELART